jgi:hypothetical protein
MQAMQQRMFQRADADQSGGISLDEFNQIQPPGAEGSSSTQGADRSKMFAKLDADGDGSLTQAEMKPPQEAMSMFSGGTMSALMDIQGGGSSSGSPEDYLLQLLQESDEEQTQSTSNDTESQNTKSTNAAQSAASDMYQSFMDILKSAQSNSSRTEAYA